MKLIIAVTVLAAGTLPSVAAQAGPVQYAKICDLHGPGYIYDPGHDSCVNVGAVTDLQRGLAASIAMPAAPMPSAPGKTTWSLNMSYITADQFNSSMTNKVGIGGSLAHRIDLFKKPMMFTVGYANGGGGFQSARVGMAGEF